MYSPNVIHSVSYNYTQLNEPTNQNPTKDISQRIRKRYNRNLGTIGTSINKQPNALYLSAKDDKLI